MHPWPSDTAVCIPSYRSATQLRELLPRVLKYVPANLIIVVDDGSRDDTAEICRKLQVHCLSHAVNRGKGAALAAGFDRCIASGMKWVITMDADGQHAPQELSRFIAASRNDPPPGICIGARSMKPGVMPPGRIVSNRLTSFILGMFCGVPVADSQCGYRLYATDFLRCIDITYSRFEMESEVILKAAFLGFPVTFTGIQTLYLKGPSHIAHVADTVRWVIAVLKITMQRRRIIRNRHCRPLSK